MAGDDRDVIIIGPQGSGKGTQAAIVAPELGLVHISVGDLFREVMASDSELGRLLTGYVNHGELVPDDLTIRMLFKRLDALKAEQPSVRGALLDGFPRNQAQAEALDRALAERGDHLTAVVHLVVPHDVLLQRLSGRLLCKVCGATYHAVLNPPKNPPFCDVCRNELYQRSDDTLEAVERRLKIYYDQTEPVLVRYAKAGLVIEIDGNRPINDVTKEILVALRPRVEVG
jgi:adenylate kinase